MILITEFIDESAVNLLKKKYWKIKYGKKKIDQSFSKEFFKLFSNCILNFQYY